MEHSLYLERYAHPVEFLAREEIPGNLGMIITIPSYHEPGLIHTLEAIHACERPDCDVEVIVLINEPENVDPEIQLENKRCFQEANQWVRWHQSSSLKYYILWINNLPEKWSGVGLARKMAMDEAVRRFRRANNPEGIILGFDADSTCNRNFLVSIKNEFESKGLKGASIYFEHPLEGQQNPRIYEGIIRYELHLRYYIMAQRYAGFPYAFHTIGSAMAVRSDIYEKQGGMNRRKAGEDFYFLHKVIPLGDYEEITGTSVFPSPRESDRVPFGTGKAMLEWMKQENDQYTTYHPGIFDMLKDFFGKVNGLFNPGKEGGETDYAPEDIPGTLRDFLTEEGFDEKLSEFREQSTSIGHFRDKFFRWFNGLKLLRFLHFARSAQFPNVPLQEAVEWLAARYDINIDDPADLREALLVIREFNRENPSSYRKQEV